MIKDVDWVGELLTDKTGKLWDDPAILQMAEDFQELREKGYFAKSVGSNVFPAAQNGEFAMGTAAMYYNGSWLPNEVAEITGDDFQWGAMFFPAPEHSVFRSLTELLFPTTWFVWESLWKKVRMPSYGAEATWRMRMSALLSMHRSQSYLQVTLMRRSL